jgi:hypothetical protein
LFEVLLGFFVSIGPFFEVVLMLALGSSAPSLLETNLESGSAAIELNTDLTPEEDEAKALVGVDIDIFSFLACQILTSGIRAAAGPLAEPIDTRSSEVFDVPSAPNLRNEVLLSSWDGSTGGEVIVRDASAGGGNFDGANPAQVVFGCTFSFPSTELFGPERSGSSPIED